MDKTLIVYGTRLGTAAETAEIIAKVLREKFSLVVDVFDLKEDKKGVKEALKTDNYQNIIIGSGIAMGLWTNQAKRFLKRDFANKRVFIFVTSGRAGKALKAKDDAAYQVAVDNYITRVIEKYPSLKPVSVKAFGGRWIKKDKVKYDEWNPERVKAWAEEIGQIIKQ